MKKIFMNENGKVRAGWKILCTFFLALVIALLFTITLMKIISSQEAPWTEWIMIMGTPIGMILATLIAMKLFNKKKLIDIGVPPIKHSWSDLAWGLGLGAASMTVIFLILWATGAVTLKNPILEPVLTNFSWIILLLYTLVGYSEELFFRGYVMRTMESTGNRKAFIYIASAIFFSIVHGMNPNVSLIGLLNVGLVGLLFAYMFEVTGSLWMPIGFHITWNFFQGAVFGFPVSGLQMQGLYLTEITQGKEWLSGGPFGPEAGILATFLIVANYTVIKFLGKKQPSVSSSL